MESFNLLISVNALSATMGRMICLIAQCKTTIVGQVWRFSVVFKGIAAIY